MRIAGTAKEIEGRAKGSGSVLRLAGEEMEPAEMYEIDPLRPLVLEHPG